MDEDPGGHGPSPERVHRHLRRRGPPDIALVIPADRNGFHLVEQYRHPIAGRSWEFPSGSTDPQQDVEVAESAARELREETGLESSRLTPLGTLDITPSTFNQRCRVFLATELTQGAPQRGPEEEDMRSACFSRGDVERMINDGTITDSKSIAAYGLLLVHESASRVYLSRPSLLARQNIVRHHVAHGPAAARTTDPTTRVAFRGGPVPGGLQHR
jgi:8-oxo-dGDP phosphatase